MTRAQERMLQHFLRLNYPLEVVVLTPTEIAGVYPDLEGCDLMASSIDELQRLMELQRRVWLRDCIESGGVPPQPNTALGSPGRPENLNPCSS